MSSLFSQKFGVLLVDDSEDDRHFMRIALRNHPRLIVVGEVCDGEDAISYLNGSEAFTDREKFPFPDVILLDLKMPRRTGFEVLEWLQTQSFKNLIVIVVSGSILPQDVAQSLALGAAAYHGKADFLEQRELMFKEIDRLLEKR
jgi:CheY-like chemotaxis protein